MTSVKVRPGEPIDPEVAQPGLEAEGHEELRMEGAIEPHDRVGIEMVVVIV